jgi:hypothetical protein
MLSDIFLRDLQPVNTGKPKEIQLSHFPSEPVPV